MWMTLLCSAAQVTRSSLEPKISLNFVIPQLYCFQSEASLFIGARKIGLYHSFTALELAASTMSCFSFDRSLPQPIPYV